MRYRIYNNYCCSRSCWNRQTGTFEGRVSTDVWVQVPSTAPDDNRNFDTERIRIAVFLLSGKGLNSGDSGDKAITCSWNSFAVCLVHKSKTDNINYIILGIKNGHIGKNCLTEYVWHEVKVEKWKTCIWENGSFRAVSRSVWYEEERRSKWVTFKLYYRQYFR